MNLSILIPVFNEEESIRVLCDEIQSVISSTNHTYEVLFIDDGSNDKSWSIINSLASNSDNIKGILGYMPDLLGQLEILNHRQRGHVSINDARLQSFGNPAYRHADRIRTEFF